MNKKLKQDQRKFADCSNSHMLPQQEVANIKSHATSRSC